MRAPRQIRTVKTFSKLKKIVAKLRSPIKGCPWDQKQTHVSLIPYVLEEAHEVADAIRNGNETDLKEELGDLLLQVVLHAQIAQENNKFCLEDIAQSISQKLIQRHPHVFRNVQVKNLEEVKKIWEAIKTKEKPLTNTKSPISDHLKSKIRSRTAIAGAMEISKKVSNAGFEWYSLESVWEKVDEELKELKEALDKKDLRNAQEELGDVLFTLINIARWCELSPEEGLAGTNKRFLDRFSYVESKLEGDLSKHSLDKMQKLWQSAKKNIDTQK